MKSEFRKIIKKKKQSKWFRKNKTLPIHEAPSAPKLYPSGHWHLYVPNSFIQNAAHKGRFLEYSHSFISTHDLQVNINY